MIGVQSGQNPKVLQEKLSAFSVANRKATNDEDVQGDQNVAS
ncbi:flagellar motor rotation protein MotA [Halalkalibacter wakoensis JCM 9140]|uniref:Flagellar motor rotation protein MotA n=1 Tax=Halalkalibacter wakoensis JCM 9140 TaxID=1236970 RepID=W4Q255_9BACI|nr:flagellar motor rotation protein MotA [Halalkalibacter wakoensis JCM 9140]